MPMNDLTAVIESLERIEFLLGVLDCAVLFVIGSVTAVIVVLILYNFLMKCISKF